MATLSHQTSPLPPLYPVNYAYGVPVQYLRVRLVGFDGTVVTIFNPALTSMEVLEDPPVSYYVTDVPHRLLISIVRRHLGPFMSANQMNRPLRFEITTRDRVHVPIEFLMHCFNQEVHMAEATMAGDAQARAFFELPMGTQPKGCKRPLRPSSFLFPSDVIRNVAMLPRAPPRAQTTTAVLGLLHTPISEHTALLSLRLYSHMFYASCKNPDGRVSKAVKPRITHKFVALPKEPEPRQLWHLRPFRPTHASIRAAAQVLFQYIKAHFPSVSVTFDPTKAFDGLPLACMAVLDASIKLPQGTEGPLAGSKRPRRHMEPSVFEENAREARYLLEFAASGGATEPPGGGGGRAQPEGESFASPVTAAAGSQASVDLPAA